MLDGKVKNIVFLGNGNMREKGRTRRAGKYQVD